MNIIFVTIDIPLMTTVQSRTSDYERLKIQSYICSICYQLGQLGTTNHKSSQLKGINKYILAITYSDLGWVNDKPHEAPGRMADGA